MDNDLEKRTLRKISWRIVPFIMLLYFVAYIDRVNIGFASLTMRTDLGVTASILGFGAGIFFWGYFLFEVPSNIALHKVGARLWIARVMVTWGIISACMAFVKGPTSFYIVRFLLGAAEAGFFPGIILYLSSGLESAEFLRLSHGLILAFVSADPVLG
ncbi:MFS transporter, partial [Caballeronia arationis]